MRNGIRKTYINVDIAIYQCVLSEGMVCKPLLYVLKYTYTLHRHTHKYTDSLKVQDNIYIHISIQLHCQTHRQDTNTYTFVTRLNNVCEHASKRTLEGRGSSKGGRRKGWMSCFIALIWCYSFLAIVQEAHQSYLFPQVSVGNESQLATRNWRVSSGPSVRVAVLMANYQVKIFIMPFIDV